MKKLIFFLLLLSNISHAQWRYDKKVDPFDGNIKKVIGFGFGGDFPYKNPKLIFRINGNKREIYISNAGSTACDKPFIDVSFGDPTTEGSYSRTVGGGYRFAGVANSRTTTSKEFQHIILGKSAGFGNPIFFLF